jgi:hypothetical protein
MSTQHEIATAITALITSILQVISWEDVKNFGNSAFTTSLIGALAGAFAGAFSAQRIAERNKVREEFFKEFRNINTVIALAFSVTNTMMVLKKQHVRAIKETYDKEVEKYKSYLSKRSTGQIQGNEPYTVKPAFHRLPPISSSVVMVQEVIFSRLSVTGRALITTTALTEAVENLNGAIAQRNDLIDVFKTGKYPEGASLEHLYLGLSYAGNSVNTEYGDLVNAVTSYTDDAIFFSHLLCIDLAEYGSKLADRFQTQLKEAPPLVSVIDFKQAKEDQLIPNPDMYASWLNGFQLASKPKKKRWWKRDV